MRDALLRRSQLTASAVPWDALAFGLRCGRSLLDRNRLGHLPTTVDDIAQGFAAVRELRVITSDALAPHPGLTLFALESHLEAHLIWGRIRPVRPSRMRSPDLLRRLSMPAGRTTSCGPSAVSCTRLLGSTISDRRRSAARPVACASSL